MSPVHADIDNRISDMFYSLIDYDKYESADIITALHEMGYIDLADAFFNWCQEA